MSEQYKTLLSLGVPELPKGYQYFFSYNHESDRRLTCAIRKRVWFFFHEIVTHESISDYAFVSPISWQRAEMSEMFPLASFSKNEYDIYHLAYIAIKAAKNFPATRFSMANNISDYLNQGMP